MPLPRPAAAARALGRAGLLAVVLLVLVLGGRAGAQPVPVPTPTPSGSDATVTIELPDVEGAPSESVLIILGLTVLSVAPALLIMVTSFTRIVIVLTITRNALGLQGVPPNQVIAGLALFLTLFVMGPTLGEVKENALDPLLAGEATQSEAWDAAVGPIRTFMLEHVDESELELFTSATTDERPEGPDDVPLAALVPAFVLSEVKAAFIIGFIVFIPFLVIDIVVSSSLMSMGMIMLPPSLVSLPFKLLLFVMVDGWALIVTSLLDSYAT